MLRVLLLIPTTTYRTEDFVAAAAKLDVEMVVASERPNVLEAALPDSLLTLDFAEPDKAARTRRGVRAAPPGRRRGSRRRSHHGGGGRHRGAPRPSVELGRGGVDRAEQAPDARGLRPGGRALAAVHAPRRRRRSRGRGRACDVPVRAQADDPRRQPWRDPGRRSARVRRRVPPDRRDPGRAGPGGARRRTRKRCWSRTSSPGARSRWRGCSSAGELHVLALFDKPDPLDGPYFEETIYVTPSRLPAGDQAAIAARRRAARRGRSGCARGRSTPSCG